MLKESSTLCALCENPVGVYLLKQEEESDSFCCRGCQIVHQILKAQNQLDSYRQHPIFKQALAAGLITNPLFSENESLSSDAPHVQKLHLVIEEMWCPSCACLIHLILGKEKGIQHSVIDYSTDLALIEYDPKTISKEKIFKTITQLGYRPSLLQDPRNENVSRSLFLRFIIAAFFSLNVMMFSYPIYATYFSQDHEGYISLFSWLSFFGSLPVIAYSGYPIWRRFFSGCLVGLWGMEALVFLGVFSGVLLSLYELLKGGMHIYFDSLTVVIVFVLLGKIIESRAKFSAKDALIRLSLSVPRKGRKKFASGEEQFVGIKEIAPGDVLVVRSGEKIVLDGIVEEGHGFCDESLMTGESVPVSKKQGEFVLAGSILQQGTLCIKTTGKFEETALHQIIEMVSQQIEHKSQYVRSADKIVRWFIPFVFFLAISTAMYCLFWEIQDNNQTVIETAAIRAISILLISCPCAIGIAAPLAEAYLLNVLAKGGVIIRNRGILSVLGTETLYVFDKTGTVTEGKFHLRSGLEKLSFEQQRILKGLTSVSIHPISVAVHHALLCPPHALENIEEIVGSGLKGSFKGKIYHFGSHEFLLKEGKKLNLPKRIQEEEGILSTVYFEGIPLFLGDQIREGIKECVDFLQSKKTLLLSGDGREPVKKVAELCGFSNWQAESYPLQKKETIEKLKKEGQIVAMFGDGMNDAPALTTAHVGITVVSASDLSIQISDILLTTPKLQSILFLYQSAAQGKKIIRQNLFWAFFYNCIGLFLAAAGYLNPLFAAFAMVISSLIVLFNAQRLKNAPTN